MKYYAYKLATGSIWVKLFTKDSKTELEMLYASDSVVDVIEDIEAKDYDQAKKKAEKELNDV